MIELSENQKSAIKHTIFWYNVSSNPYFILGGYAGTGKTFITKNIIEELGLKEHEVIYCAYTGKATQVLIKKGNKSALTIHKAFYDVREILDPRTNSPIKTFVKKAAISPLIKLIVIDEFSMVPDKMFEDILSFGAKVLCLCDPGQLPPVKAVNTYAEKLDLLLTEIFRQDDNGIIDLSFDIRNKKRIYTDSDYGKNVLILDRDEFLNDDKCIEYLSKASQVLCWRNSTRMEINNLIREYKGFDNSALPVKGDKIIITKNNWDIMRFSLTYDCYMPLVNGMIGTVTEDSECNNPVMLQKANMFITSFESDGTNFNNIWYDKTPFYGEEATKEELKYRADHSITSNTIDFGYAITVHKAQGSQFKSVIVYDERGLYNMSDDYRRWLYTAVTRTEKNLILITK